MILCIMSMSNEHFIHGTILESMRLFWNKPYMVDATVSWRSEVITGHCRPHSLRYIPLVCLPLSFPSNSLYTTCLCPMHLPFTPNHIHLISTCYPPSSALLTSGPEYLPNSQELSRLTYYASNRPGKINKLANELDKRVRADCRRAQAGNTRSRA